MMYLLKESKGEGLHYLISGKSYIVGRKSVDIVIENDASISRKHAIISVEGDVITLTDCDSKYGTCHNNKKIVANSKVPMNSNDKIKFGVYQSIYTIEKLNIVTTGSGLNSSQKSELKNTIDQLGGLIVNNWSPTCTHLTTQEIVLTIKVLLALIDNRPFVKVEYWKRFLSNAQGKLPPPNIADFKPPLTETLVDSSDLGQNPLRKVLFKGKTFVFPTVKLKAKMEELIERTGGTSISWDRQPLSLLQVTSNNNYLFVHSEEIKQIPQSLLDVHVHLKKLGQRTIPIQEIAMAVLTCSCEKDCNPNFNRVERVFLKEETVDSQSEIFPLAHNTPTQESQELRTKEEVIIPESLDEDVNAIPIRPVVAKSTRQPLSTVNTMPSTSGIGVASTKRTSDEISENACKKMKPNSLEINQSQRTGETRKRKAESSAQAPAEKSCLRENPLAIFKNRNSANRIVTENIFSGLAIKKEATPCQDNSFMRVTMRTEDKKTEEVEPEPQVKTVSVNIEPSSYESVRSSNSDLTWLSKTMCKSEQVEIEEEFKGLFELFKNVTVLKDAVLVSQRLANGTHSVNETPTNRTANGKNFKKFKKVVPRKPQVTILEVVNNQIATDQPAVPISEDEEEEERPRVMVAKVNRKRFAF